MVREQPSLVSVVGERKGCHLKVPLILADVRAMRRVLVCFMVVSALIQTIPAGAADTYPIVFPVDGPNRYIDTWGAARAGGRTHEGTDIMAAKMTPVVAAVNGVVGWVHNVRGGNCCALELIHDDNFRSRYIHLNNDSPGTDDGQGWGFAPGITTGVRVQAGQLIGYVGDSGNAEATSPHLHFELRDQNNIAFNSYPSLLAARPPSSVAWYAAAVGQAGLETIPDPVGEYVVESGVVVPGDFDGDGQSEVAVGGGLDAGWKVAELNGGSEPWSTTDASAAVDVLTGDFDGDGDDDIGAFWASGTWTGYRSSGTGFAVEHWGRFGGSSWVRRVVGDFDGDGDDDILSFHPPTRNWWVSNLVGTSLSSRIFTSYGTAFGWQTHLAGDVNGDGIDELLSFHPSNGTWWATNAFGRPRLVVDVSTNTGWQHLSVVDADGDGADELAMFHPSNGTWWLVDDSAGPSLALWARFSTRSGWVNPVAADFDDDGNEDLLIRHESTGRVWALRGHGGGSLSFLGTLVSGAVEGEWLIEIAGDTPGLLVMIRN